MTKDHEFFMRRAIEMAAKGMNSNAGGPFGAVVVKDGEIIAEGHNKVTFTNDPTAHAEMVVIRDACKKLNTFPFFFHVNPFLLSIIISKTMFQSFCTIFVAISLMLMEFIFYEKLNILKLSDSTGVLNDAN